MTELTIPCSYQGGKQRLAKDILEEINKNTPLENKIFLDLCCGSGAITLESLKYNTKQNIMLDNGCMGLFWNSIVNKTFDIDYFEQRIKELPSLDKIQQYMKDLSKQPVNNETLVYDYILMQASAFGSKQIWVDKKWCNCTFRSYWLPTETSNRKSPVNPMMPLPATLLDRIKNLIYNLPINKISVYTLDILEYLSNINNFNDMIIYVDPPYQNTTGYHSTFDINKVIEIVNNKCPLYISEGYDIPSASEYIHFGKRNKGNISGNKKIDSVVETLNIFT